MTSHIHLSAIGRGQRTVVCSGSKDSGMTVQIKVPNGMLDISVHHNSRTDEDTVHIMMRDNPRFGCGSGRQRDLGKFLLDNGQHTYEDLDEADTYDN